MIYGNLLRVGAAVAVCLGGLTVMAPSVAAKSRTVVVQARSYDMPVRHVSYADLNLLTATGERTLTHRVGGAVRDVCADWTDTTRLDYSNAICTRAAWDGARPQMDRAIQRAREIALNGQSTIAPVGIEVAFAK